MPFVKIAAYVCLAVSGLLAGLYGYTTGNTEVMGILRAVGWGAVAVVGGCCPAWFVAHIETRRWGRAVFTGLVCLVCAGVTLGGSIGGLTGSGDKFSAERAKSIAATKEDQAELTRATSARAAMHFQPTTAESVNVAREAVLSAERIQAAECGKRGPLCRDRETEEQAKRDALSSAISSKAATDAAAELDRKAANLRNKLDKAAAVLAANPGAAAVSRLLHIEVDDAVSWQAFLGALALELAGMAAMIRAESPKPLVPRPNKPEADTTQARPDPISA